MIVRTLAAVLVVLTCTSAFGGAFEVEAQDAAMLGTANAGRTAQAENASTVFFNPAGMTRLRGNVATIGLSYIPIDVDFSDTGSTDAFGIPMMGETSRNGGVDEIVPHLYGSFQLSDEWFVGLAVNTPFGLGTKYGDTWSGRYWATTSELAVFNIQPSFAFAATPEFSIGFGLNVSYADGELGNMIDFGSLGAANQVPGLFPQANDGSVTVTGDGFAFGFTLGALYEFSERTRVGFSYRSELNHTLDGEADFTVPTEADALTGGGTLFQDTGARVPLPLPWSVSMSVYHEFDDRWAVVGDATWTGWGDFEAFVVAFDNPNQPEVNQAADWRNAVRVGVGGIFRPDDKWTVRLGCAFEQTAVPDATREPRVPVEDRYWLTAGVGYRFSDTVTLDLAYLQWFSPDADIDISSPEQGALRGTVDWFVAAVGATVTLEF